MFWKKCVPMGLVLAIVGFAADSTKATPDSAKATPDSAKAAPKKAAGASKKAKKADLAAGKKVFETYCIACHGATGQGDGAAAAALNPKPRNLADTAYMKTRTREQLRKVISEGGQASGFSPLMAAWKGTLKETEIDAVLDYVLAFSRKK